MQVFFPKKTKQLRENYKKKRDERKAIDVKKKELEIHPNEIPGKLYQFIESIELMSSSKNPDIVIGRYSFCEKLCLRLALFNKASLYEKQVYQVIEEYKENYYDKNIREEQIYFATHPEDHHRLEEYYIKQLARCFGVYAQNHQEKIDGMKQKKAMVGRYDKILEAINMILDELEKLTDTETRKQAVEQLNAFIPHIKSKIADLK
jgi:hypothetical protein